MPDRPLSQSDLEALVEGAGLSVVAYQDPQWEKAGRVHDWRNHVGERTRSLWHTFTDAQKIALVLDANERASAENWE